MIIRTARADELVLARDIDDDACALYAEVGLGVLLAKDHPFTLGEDARWGADAAAGRMVIAEIDGEAAGFMCCHLVDGAPYLDQLSVRPRFGRRGLGTLLIDRAVAWAEPHSALWLTTYGHVPWNRPYYERRGFVVVPESECGPEIRAILESQRAALPAPEERVAMVRRW